MTQKSNKNTLIGIGVIVTAVLLGLSFWTINQKPQQQLTIGISPSFAKSIQVATDEIKAQGIQVKLVEFSD